MPDERDPPPAGLTEHPAPGSVRPRPGLGLAVAIVLALAAAGRLFAAATGIGPADVDREVLSETLDVRTDALTTLAVVITEAGNTAAMAVLASAVGIVAWRRGRRADAVFVVGAMAGAAVLFRSLKILFDRHRPPVVSRLVEHTSESLPSGHATMSIVVIGSLVVLAWNARGAPARVAMVAAATAWVAAVGYTRIYLGVHWFSDVLAGWLVGGAWLALCAAVWSAWRSRQHHRAPPEPVEN
jgi:membrane-associated phospholipid phosphatase